MDQNPTGTTGSAGKQAARLDIITLNRLSQPVQSRSSSVNTQSLHLKQEGLQHQTANPTYQL